MAIDDKQGIEHYYAGDAAWEEYASLFESEDVSEQLVKACGGDEAMAKVINYHLGNQALYWMDEMIPALNDLTPRACIDSPGLTNRVRECLMRFP